MKFTGLVKTFEMKRVTLEDFIDCLKFREPLTEKEITARVDKTKTVSVYPNLSSNVSQKKQEWFNEYTKTFYGCRTSNTARTIIPTPESFKSQRRIIVLSTAYPTSKLTRIINIQEPRQEQRIMTA